MCNVRFSDIFKVSTSNQHSWLSEVCDSNLTLHIHPTIITTTIKVEKIKKIIKGHIIMAFYGVLNSIRDLKI